MLWCYIDEASQNFQKLSTATMQDEKEDRCRDDFLETFLPDGLRSLVLLSMQSRSWALKGSAPEKVPSYSESCMRPLCNRVRTAG